MTVTSVTAQIKRPSRSSVFIDGEFAFGMDSGDLAALSVKVGMELDEGALKKLMDEKIFADAKNAALKYLSHRARTQREIEKRLEEYGFPPETIIKTLELVKKYKYVDDEAFARDYAESRLNSGNYGPRRIMRELKIKGVPDLLAKNAMAAALANYDEDGAVAAWLKRKSVDPAEIDDKKRRRLANSLAAGGFSFESARRALSGESYE